VTDDEHLSLLLEASAQVAISVDLQLTLQILLDSLNKLVPFDAAGIFVREPERRVVRGSGRKFHHGVLRHCRHH
jgi:hypothetical protein